MRAVSAVAGAVSLGVVAGVILLSTKSIWRIITTRNSEMMGGLPWPEAA